jgi:uncharacterized membrane protein YcaP (DUF421 family)
VLFPVGAHVALQIALRTGVIYLVVLIGVRLSGKLEVGQMTLFDLTLLLLLSNSVQNAMTGPDTSLIGGVIAASTRVCCWTTRSEPSLAPAAGSDGWCRANQAF